MKAGGREGVRDGGRERGREGSREGGIEGGRVGEVRSVVPVNAKHRRTWSWKSGILTTNLAAVVCVCVCVCVRKI